MKPIVIIESPFKGATPEEEEGNIRYLRAALRDCLLRGEAPFASHAIYTLDGVLDDDIPKERQLGMEAGWEFFNVANKVVVYVDRKISSGMRAGIARAKEHGLEIELRSIPNWNNPKTES